VSRTWSEGDPWDPGNPENRDRTRALRGELRQRLLAWDPIGIADAPEAQDEYDCMLSPLMHQLHDGASEDQVQQWLVHELESHFGLTPVPRREEALASELTAWWREATRA